MFLVSPHQLKRLTQPAKPSIRQTVEDDLDERMRAILREPGLSSYEKVKRYEALLRRYLTLMKQGQNEERQVTLRLQSDPSPLPAPPPAESDPAHPPPLQESDWVEFDDTTNEILKSLPPRDRKNASYIMQKFVGGDGGWTSRDEFIYWGNVVKGSHMIDLFKNLSLSYKKPNSSKRLDDFLKYAGGTKHSLIFGE